MRSQAVGHVNCVCPAALVTHAVVLTAALSSWQLATAPAAGNCQPSMQHLRLTMQHHTTSLHWVGFEADTGARRAGFADGCLLYSLPLGNVWVMHVLL